MAGGALQCCGRRGFAGGDASGGQFVGDEPVPERGVVVVDHPQRRIDCVSRYLWAKLSWVPDSSTFDGICLMSANYKVTVQDEGFVEVMYFGKPSLTTLYPSWRIYKIEV